MEYKPFSCWHKLKIALGVFLLGMIVIIFVFSFFYYHEFKEEKGFRELRTSNIVAMQKIKLGNEFRYIAADIMFFANYNQLLNTLEDPSSHEEQLKIDLLLLNMVKELNILLLLELLMAINLLKKI